MTNHDLRAVAFDPSETLVEGKGTRELTTLAPTELEVACHTLRYVESDLRVGARRAAMRRVVHAVMAVILATVLPTTVVGYETPEAAVREYLEGVSNADIEQVLASTAADEMAAGFRFDELVERVQMYSVTLDGPTHSPFFAEVQRRDFEGEPLWQARHLAYSLLAPDAFGEALNGDSLRDVGRDWAADLMGELDESRLAGLVVVDIGRPTDERYDSTFNRELLARSASMYGADEQTDRVALILYEGDTYGVGFTLLRYGDDWKVKDQRSPFSGLNLYGAAEPMTSLEFSELFSE